MRGTRLAQLVLAALVSGALLAAPAQAEPPRAVTPAEVSVADASFTREGIVALAHQQVGNGCGAYPGACSVAWCAVWAKWVWGGAGVGDLDGLDAWAGSFYEYGKERGLVRDMPQIGDAALFTPDDNWENGVPGQQFAHVSIVVGVRANGAEIQTVGGNESNSVQFRNWFNWRTQGTNGPARAFVSPEGLEEEWQTSASSQVRADFNGDGRDDIGLFYDYSGTAAAVFTMLARDDGSFAAPVKRWQGDHWGNNTKSMTAGDYDGDGRADIALFYDYAHSAKAAVFTLKGNTDGSIGVPVRRWESDTWGNRTQGITSGDYNGDGKADIALLYDYYDTFKAAVFTLNGNADGSLAGPARRWEGDTWGDRTKGMTSGDYDGDGRADIALFYDYADGPQVALFTLKGNADGSLGAPARRWESDTWGDNTQAITSGDYNGDGKADIGLLYNYDDSPEVALFTMNGGAGGSLAAPVKRWGTDTWGNRTKGVTSGDYNGDGRADVALVYDYDDSPAAAVFTLSGGSGGALGGAVKRWQSDTWGNGTKAMV